MSVLFVSHGAPTEAIESDGWTAALRDLGNRLQARAVVVMSSHGSSDGPIRVTTSEQPQTLHDFHGFPEELSQVRYPCPGSPFVAGRVLDLLAEEGIEAEADDERGLDHAVWVPMLHLRPEADLPVVQIQQPQTRAACREVGEALRPLRDEGVLLVGSGGLVHNLGALRWDRKVGAVEPWARAFEDWVMERIDAGDQPHLVDAPNGTRAHPHADHWHPLHFALGARRPGEPVENVFVGTYYGSLSMRTFGFGLWASEE